MRYKERSVSTFYWLLHVDILEQVTHTKQSTVKFQYHVSLKSKKTLPCATNDVRPIPLIHYSRTPFDVTHSIDHATLITTCRFQTLLLFLSPSGRGNLPVSGRLQKLAHEECQAQPDHNRWERGIIYFEFLLSRVTGRGDEKQAVQTNA